MSVTCQVRTYQFGTRQFRNGQFWTGQNGIGQVGTGQVGTFQVSIDQGWTGQVRTDHNFAYQPLLFCDATQTKIHLRMEFDSGPTCLIR